MSHHDQHELDGGLTLADLTTEDKERLKNSAQLSEFQRDKLNKDAKKNWDLFYKRHGDRFFKNRYWTRREFKELFESGNTSHKDQDEFGSKSMRYLLEVGCGCGDFVLPLLDDESSQHVSNKDLFIYCCDISDKAIEILESKPLFKKYYPTHIKAFTADITQDCDRLLAKTESNLMDVVSFIFVLSALDPKHMRKGLENVHSVMKPKGLILFRDYAIYDEAMLRFGEKSKICDQFYVRQDGTRAYFFSKEQLVRLFESCGFECQSIDYVKRETVNKVTTDKFSRIFLQAKFTKKE